MGDVSNLKLFFIITRGKARRFAPRARCSKTPARLKRKHKGKHCYIVIVYARCTVEGIARGT